MRLTCLRCGNQMELAASGPRVGTICTCGTEISYPEVYNTGVRPNERAAERLRYRAFRAAGLVKNLGGFAIGLALLGILFFPLALCGAVLGTYVLTMVRGPLGRYSGRNAAIAAIGAGVLVFATEGTILWSYVSHRRAEHFTALQASAADDLRTLLRTERLYKAAQDRFGTIKESRFSPRGGHYTIYLALDDFIPAVRDGETVTDRLPADAHPRLTDTSFTAVAVANLDGDADLDVWVVDDSGELQHVANDVPWLPPPRELSPPPQSTPLAAGGNKTTIAPKNDKPVSPKVGKPKLDPPKVEQAKPNEPRPDSSKSDQPKLDPPKTDPSSSGQSKLDPPKTDPSKSDQPTLDQANPEAAKPEKTPPDDRAPKNDDSKSPSDPSKSSSDKPKTDQPT